jgi:predicted chitinase
MTNWNHVVRNLAPNARPEIVAMIADHADEQFAKWGITTIRRQAAVLAHACVETEGFTRLEENLNYSAERLHEVWPNRFPSVAAAQPYAHNPRALAIKVYGGRMGNLPNTEDGWIFRGKGIWQCTGHNNCVDLGKKLGVGPDVAAAWLIHPEHALECVCALFSLLGVGPSADSGNLTEQTKRINGGYNGLTERKEAFAKALRLLAAATAQDRISLLDNGGPPEEVTTRDLRAAGSRTIKGADQAQSGLVGALGSLGGATAVVSQTQDVAEQVQSAVETIQSSAGMLAWAQSHWQVIALVIALAAAGYFVWRAWRGASLVKLARVDDANTGVNLAR